MASSVRALLLDFGGVVLLTPFELRARAERDLGLAAGAFEWAGPYDPGSDPLWRRFQAGVLTEREYWADRARLVGELIGRPDLTSLEFFRSFYEPAGDDLVRPEALPVIDASRAAGLPVGVLTNDLEAFHGPAWRAEMAVLDHVDALVDGSVSGVLKPDPEAYRLGVEALGVDAGSALFVDDQPVNIEGARAVGLQVRWFDVTDPAGSWQALADSLGLPTQHE